MKSIIKYKHLQAIILLVLVSGFSSSCKKYLTEEPTTNFSADFVYNTPEGLELGVVALYNLQRSFYENAEWNYAIPQIIEAKTDLTFARTGEINLFGTLSWGASLGDFGTTRYGHYWRTFYKIIDRANAVIKGAEAVQGISEAQRNQILAEAKCFRARSYFILYRLFNNIYITTEPTTPENALDLVQDKSSEAEIFNLINSDLDFAIANLAWTTPQFGRYTQGAARHIRAQSAMWQKNWVEAKTQAEAVIKNGTYSLLPNCKDVFRNNLKHSETILAIQYVPLIQGGGSPQRFSFLQLPQYGAVPGAQYSLEFGGRGAGQLILNPYLRSLLAADPKDIRDDNTYYVSFFTYNDPANLPAGVKLGDTIKVYKELSTNSSEAANWRIRLNPGCRKYSQEDGIPTEASQISNIMVYRLAETYLMAAEATWRISQNNADPVALGYLNAVRTRAKCSPATVINQQALLDEDARELAFEGKRFYTLKRMGVMEEQITKYAGYENGPYAFINARTRYKPYMQNWPIPVAEIRLLGSNYPQNEGY